MRLDFDFSLVSQTERERDRERDASQHGNTARPSLDGQQSPWIPPLTIWSFFLLHFNCILRRWQCLRWQWRGQQHHRAAVRPAPAHVAEASVGVGAELCKKGIPRKKREKKRGRFVCAKTGTSTMYVCMHACMWVYIYIHTHTGCFAAADVAVLLHLENLHHALSTLDPAYSSGTWFDPHAERDWRTFGWGKSNYRHTAFHPWPGHALDSCWIPLVHWLPCKCV